MNFSYKENIVVYYGRIATIFISSPGDVLSDRKLACDLISAWNQRNGREKSLVFLPLTWEDAVSAGISERSQEVINEQIGNNYDIFLGLMWSRFGTPTGQAESGTQEEFENAIDQRGEGTGPEICFLFNTSPVPFKNIDTIQINKINDFKLKISDTGCFYREYSDEASLHGQIITILDKFSSRISRDNYNSESASLEAAMRSDLVVVEDGGDDEDLGLLDLHEMLEDASEKFSKLMADWTARVTRTGDIASGAADELAEIQKFGQPNSQQIRKNTAVVADAMNDAAEWCEDNINEIQRSIDDFCLAQQKIISITEDFKVEIEEIDSTIETCNELIESINSANISLKSLAESTLHMPRMTKDINKSKKRLFNVIQSLIQKNETFSSNMLISMRDLREIKARKLDGS